MIIILTDYDIPEYREAAARFKADYFFSKDSMTIEEVVPLVKSRFCQKEGCKKDEFGRQSSPKQHVGITPLLPVIVNHQRYLGNNICRCSRQKGYLDTVRQLKYWSGQLIDIQ